MKEPSLREQDFLPLDYVESRRVSRGVKTPATEKVALCHSHCTEKTIVEFKKSTVSGAFS